MNFTYGISLMRKVCKSRSRSKSLWIVFKNNYNWQGFFAFHCERGVAYKIIEDTFYEHEKCGLIEIDYMSQIEPWIPIQKHSPYKEIIKVLWVYQFKILQFTIWLTILKKFFFFFESLIRIREHGIQFREVSRIYTKRPICSSHGLFESVRLIDCQIVLMILAYGFLFSFVIFIIEKIVHARSIDSTVCLF